MAAFGAKYPKFAQISGEEDGKLPVYNREKSLLLGELVKADLAVEFASGELYASDRLCEKTDEFISGSIAMEVDELKNKDAVVLYGSKINESGEKVDNSQDVIPYGGLGYIKSLMKNGKKFYRGYYYPKVKAVMGNDNAASKQKSITFTTTPITFTVYEPVTGDWRYTKEFDSVSDAEGWVDVKLNLADAAENLPGADIPTTEEPTSEEGYGL